MGARTVVSVAHARSPARSASACRLGAPGGTPHDRRRWRDARPAGRGPRVRHAHRRRPPRRPARRRARPSRPPPTPPRRCGSAPSSSATTTATPSSPPRSWPPIDVLSRRSARGRPRRRVDDDRLRAGRHPLDRPGTRIDRLVEALDVLEALWADGPATVDGDHYRDHRARRPPEAGAATAPAAAPRRRRPADARRSPARRADIVGINVNLAKGVIDADAGPDGTAERTDEKVALGARRRRRPLRRHRAAGARAPRRRRPTTAPAWPRRSPPASASRPPTALAVAARARRHRRARSSTTSLARRERWGISYIGVEPRRHRRHGAGGRPAQRAPEQQLAVDVARASPARAPRGPNTPLGRSPSVAVDVEQAAERARRPAGRS